MDYFLMALGGFSPQTDRDAAVKFCLQAVLSDHRLGELAQLLTDRHPVGEIAGDPGWTLQRRDEGDIAPGYSCWPDGMRYRAAVDPEGYQLAYPEGFYDKRSFHEYVRLAMNAYAARHPDRVSEINRVVALL
jgi:hypothetical protein